jgi:hypothetical protein
MPLDPILSHILPVYCMSPFVVLPSPAEYCHLIFAMSLKPALVFTFFEFSFSYVCVFLCTLEDNGKFRRFEVRQKQNM